MIYWPALLVYGFTLRFTESEAISNNLAVTGFWKTFTVITISAHFYHPKCKHSLTRNFGCHQEVRGTLFFCWVRNKPLCMLFVSAGLLEPETVYHGLLAVNSESWLLEFITDSSPLGNISVFYITVVDIFSILSNGKKYPCFPGGSLLKSMLERTSGC